jgi:hypothetical protein
MKNMQEQPLKQQIGSNTPDKATTTWTHTVQLDKTTHTPRPEHNCKRSQPSKPSSHPASAKTNSVLKKQSSHTQ